MSQPDPAVRWRLPCPECGHEHVHLSRQRLFEKLLRWLSYVPYRCYSCGHRFLHHRVKESAGRAPEFDYRPPRTTCPNCSLKYSVDLSFVEYQEARLRGFLMSCPGCRATFVARFEDQETAGQ